MESSCGAKSAGAHDNVSRVFGMAADVGVLRTKFDNGILLVCVRYGCVGIGGCVNECCKTDGRFSEKY